MDILQQQKEKAIDCRAPLACPCSNYDAAHPAATAAALTATSADAAAAPAAAATPADATATAAAAASSSPSGEEKLGVRSDR